MASGAIGAVGAVGSAVSAGSSLFSMFGGSSSNEAAEAAAERQSQASQINLMRLVLENQRKQAEIGLERDWSAFEYEDAAQWGEAWTGVDVAYAKTAANLEKQTMFADAAATIEGNAISLGNSVDLAVLMASGIRSDALKQAELTNMLARAKAQAARNEGVSAVRDAERERDYAMEEQQRAANDADGEVRAAVAAKGIAASGSALDVLQANQDLSLKKQKYLASKSAAAITEARYKSGMEATTAEMAGHVQAWETLSDALRTSSKYLMQADAAIEETTAKAAAMDKVLGAKAAEMDLALNYKVASLEIQGGRQADLTRRAGWREDQLAERESYNTLWETQYAMMDEMFSGGSSASAASTYGSSGTDWGKVASGAAGVAKGATGVFSSGKDAGWWGKTTNTWSTGSSLLNWGSSTPSSTDMKFYGSFLDY